MLAGGKMVLLSALVGRMYYLQVVEAERYRTLSDENRINLRLLPPLRGRIMDRFGIAMADNHQNYRLLLIAEAARDVNLTLDALGRIIPIGDGERRRVLRDIGRNRSFVPVTIRENLNWEEVARIEVNTPDLPGAMIDVGQSRFYPYGMDVAHVLGYVAAVSPKEVTGDPLLELPGFRIGKAGIEKIHDLALRGSGGSSFTVSWEDSGESFLYGLRAGDMPTSCEVFFIAPATPDRKYRVDKARRLLGWEAEDTFEELYRRPTD